MTIGGFVFVSFKKQRVILLQSFYIICNWCRQSGMLLFKRGDIDWRQAGNFW